MSHGVDAITKELTMVTTMSTSLLFGRHAFILLCSLLLGGCQLGSQPAKTAPPVAMSSGTVITPAATAEAAHSEKYDSDKTRLQQCQGQLEALKIMNPVEYKRMRNAFDYLMNGAAQYADVRSKTNADTQDTVDSLYRYRANLICAQIAQMLLDNLTNRGEARP